METSASFEVRSAPSPYSTIVVITETKENISQFSTQAHFLNELQNHALSICSLERCINRDSYGSVAFDFLRDDQWILIFQKSFKY
jgi:hypothetical protein